MSRLTACTMASLVALATALSGCGEKPQSAGTRKADASPSQGAVAAYTAPGWTPGDATSWEAQVKKRAEGQSEYNRIAHK